VRENARTDLPMSLAVPMVAPVVATTTLRAGASSAALGGLFIIIIIINYNYAKNNSETSIMLRVRQEGKESTISLEKYAP
jgi:hypothetical protein